MINSYKRNEPFSLADTYKAFFEAMQFNSVEQLTVTAEKVFSLPVMIIDENDKPLFQSPSKKLGNKNWDNYYSKTPLSSEEREKARMYALADKPPCFDPFIIKFEGQDTTEVIFGQINYNNKLYGYFAIYLLGNKTDIYDIERAKIFSQAIGFVMHSQKYHLYSLNTLLFDALSSDLNEYMRSQAIEKLHSRLNGGYTIIAKPISQSASSSTFATASINHILELGLKIVITIYDDFIIVLYGGLKNKTHLKTDKNIIRIEEFLRSAGKGCGISSVFNNLYDIKGYTKQAQMTALFTDKNIEYYDDIAPSPIFELVSRHSNAEVFIHPVLNEIFSYDIKNKTDYFETLRVYSLLMHNKEHTASELCIHRTTLLYRLNRISEIFNIPFEEPQTALHLLNSFQLWDITKNKH